MRIVDGKISWSMSYSSLLRCISFERAPFATLVFQSLADDSNAA